MKKINKIIMHLILLVCLVCFAFAQQPTLLSLQGKLTNTSTGMKIISADLRVNITDSNDNLIFNHSFSNAVSNGMFDLLLGSTYYLNLSYNEDYNLSIYVGSSDTPVGGPYWFRGGQGEVGAGDIATNESFVFGNVNISGGLNVTDGDVLLATSGGNVGIGTGSPNQALHLSSSTTWKPVLKLENTNDDASSSEILFTKTSASEADDDRIGTILFASSAGNLAHMKMYASDISAGDEAGRMDFLLTMDGTANIRSFLNMHAYNGVVNQGEIIFNDDAQDVDFRVEGVGEANALFVQGSDGNVGIGNTIPNNTLDVSGDANISGIFYAGSANITNTIEAAYFVGDGSLLSGIDTAFTNYSDINVTHFVANHTLFVNGSRVGINTSSPTSALHVLGDVNITENLYVMGNVTSGGADLAEKIMVKGKVSAGDVLVIDEYDDETLKLSERPYSTNVAGVISTNPSIIMSEETDGIAVALAGRVPVKVTNENGAINRGDLLTTSSTKGHAMKCNAIERCFGSIIGKAMTQLKDEKGTVIMIIALS